MTRHLEFAPREPDAMGSAAPMTSRAASALVSIVGIVGVAVLACVLCGWAFGLSVLVFTTGSMAPAMPTGTAAVVQHVLATDVAVGDVVTVPRPGQDLPVTHRVVAIAEVPSDAAARSLVLQGDANDTADREPYVVRTVERVVVAVPGGAVALSVLRSPTVVGITAGVIAMALLWSFWPRGYHSSEASQSVELPESSARPVAAAAPSSSAAR